MADRRRMNVDRLGHWDVARAHPGDGLLDVIEVGAEMSFRVAGRPGGDSRRGRTCHTRRSRPVAHGR